MIQRLSIRLAYRVKYLLILICLSSCSVDSAKNHYILGDKLWNDRNYSAAVTEFEKVIAKDPKGKLGMQATYRAAMTEYLFLAEYGNAIRKFRNYVEFGTDPALVWNSQLQIGEIYYTNTGQFDQAVIHYKTLLSKLLKEKQDTAEAGEFLFRVGKSQFFLFQFTDAIATFEEIQKKAEKLKTWGHWAEKASFEIGVSYFTRGEQNHSGLNPGVTDYQTAIRAYDNFIRNYPKSDLVAEARFGIASCLEELNRLDEALKTFATLKDTYPSPQVIQIKLVRIRERIAQRSR